MRQRELSASSFASPIPDITQMHCGEICAHRFAVHGLAVHLACELPALNLPIHRALGEFCVDEFPAGFAQTAGVIRSFDQSTVLRHLSPRAVPLAARGDFEIYQEDERFWIVDDRWGLTQLNVLKGTFSSWILPRPKIDPCRVIDAAVLWPIAQLLRGKGLWLLPAMSLMLDGRGILVIAPFGIEPELCAAVSAGAKLIAQQWSALRDDDGRVAMLHMPGRIERPGPFRLRFMHADVGTAADASLDLSTEFPGSILTHGFCDSVLLIGRGRRPLPMLRCVPRPQALAALKQAWPIIELHPQRRSGILAAKLAQQCSVYEAQLSRDPNELVTMLGRIASGSCAAPTHLRVNVTVAAEARRQRIPA